MFKKVSIVVFVILFLISCGLGYWSYTIYDQVKTLDTEAQDFKTATASQFTAAQESIAGVDSKIADFKTETTNQFSSVQSNIPGLDSDLTTFKTATASNFGVAQDNINR